MTLQPAAEHVYISGRMLDLYGESRSSKRNPQSGFCSNSNEKFSFGSKPKSFKEEEGEEKKESNPQK